MDPITLGAAGIAAGGSILGSLFGSGISGKTAKTMQLREQQFNREMAEWQNQVNLQNWQMQNEYNTPANQMQRYQEAGLNPNLIYGQGSNGNAAAAPQAAQVHAAPGKLPQYNFGDLGMSAAVDAYYKGRQQRNADAIAAAQVDFTKAQEAQAVQNTALKNVETLAEMLKYNRDSRLDRVLENQIRLGVDLLGAQVNSERQRQTNMATENSLLESRIRNTDMQTDLLQAQLNLTPVQASLMHAQVREIAQRIVESQSRVGLYGANTRGRQLENSFLTQTYEDRVQRVTADLESCYLRNSQGRLEFNIRSFEAHEMNRVGTSVGYKSIQNLPVDIIRSLINLGNRVTFTE